MDVVIRAARLEDAEDVVRAHEAASDSLFRELIGRPLEDFVPFEVRVKQYRQSLAKTSESAAVLVAERGDRIIGMAVWRREEGGEGELRDLHVIPEAWGTGVAQDLIEAAVAGLRGAGVDEAFLWVGEANCRARRFYEREGWEHDGGSRPTVLGPTELRYRLSLGRDRPSE